MKELERKVDVRLVLRAYQKIVDAGRREGDSHRLGELVARTDFDGYTVTLTDGTVTVSVLFHSRVSIDAPSGRTLETFVRRLQQLDG